MRKTLKDLKDSGAASRLGMAPCSDEFIGLVNRVQSDLAYAGRWWGTYQQLRWCPQTNNCVVWPRGVLNVERLKRCNEVVPVRPLWYEFQSIVVPPNTDPDHNDCRRNLLDRGTTPVVSQIVSTGNSKKVRVYATNAADAGARVLVQGLDWTGTPVRTNDATAGWVDGEYVAATLVGATTTNTFSVITGIQKPITKTTIRIYEYDTVALTERWMSDYQSSETNPTYRQSILTGFECPTTANDEPDGCNRLPTCERPLLTAIVRLEPLTVVADSDWLLIQNLSAIEDAMRALQYQQDKHLPVDAEPSWKLAIRKLNQELEARTGGPQQVIVNVKPLPVRRRTNFVGGF